MNARADKTTGEVSGLALLRLPFPAHQISKLPKPYKSDSPKGKCSECGGYHGLPAMHLDYVGHAALTDRLLDADPAWSWEPLAFGPDGYPLLDKDGGMWIKLTVCGVTRLGYGDAQGKTGANAVKERIGDALRNAAMRFGAALDLWHKGDLHGDAVDDDEEPAGLSESARLDFQNAIDGAADADSLKAVWKEAVAACKSAEDMAAYKTLKERVDSRAADLKSKEPPKERAAA